MRKIILALILAAAMRMLAATIPTLVHTTESTVSTFTISSTGAGHSILLPIIATTQPTVVTVGSQLATKNANCGSGQNPVGIVSLCLWYVASATGSQTSVTVTGASNLEIWEYEYSGTNTGSLIDQFGNADDNTDISMSLMPSQSGEAIVAIVGCIEAPNQTVSGEPATFSSATYLPDSSMEATTGSTALETVFTSGCGDGSTSGSATGAMWSIRGASTAVTHTHTWLMSALDEQIWRWHDARPEDFHQFNLQS